MFNIQIIKSISLVVLLTIIGALGYFVYEDNGFKFRFSTEIQELISAKYSYASAYREGTNFLRPDQGFESFNLTRSINSSSKGTMILWGDSHAAHLYPGYKFSSDGYEILQLTSSGCPPIKDLIIEARPHCVDINNKIIKFIGEVKPAKVILAGFWVDYNWHELSKTIESLQKIGITNIDLVGPDPIWNGGLPKMVYKNRFNSLFQQENTPIYIKNIASKKIKKIDKEMEIFAKSQHVRYISPISILCIDEENCLAQTDKSYASLIAWDYGHLTEHGSIYLVSKFPNSFYGDNANEK